MSEADKIMNRSSYINNVFVRIHTKWPELGTVVLDGKEAIPSIQARERLNKIIGYDGVNTFDGIIKHIEKNEHMIDWWIL